MGSRSRSSVFHSPPRWSSATNSPSDSVIGSLARFAICTHSGFSQGPHATLYILDPNVWLTGAINFTPCSNVATSSRDVFRSCTLDCVLGGRTVAFAIFRGIEVLHSSRSRTWSEKTEASVRISAVAPSAPTFAFTFACVTVPITKSAPISGMTYAVTSNGA